MLPRKKLIQCFNCMNNIECWGLNEDIPLGLNERDNALSAKALTLLIANYLENEEVSAGDQFGILSMAFLQTLRFDGKSPRREVYQVLSVMAAMVNSSNDDWHCSGEGPNPEVNGFVYEEKE
jgi:hypothetical protein